MWRPVLLAVILLVISSFLLTYKIADLLSGYSNAEIEYYRHVMAIPWLPSTQLYLPFLLLEKLVLQLTHSGIIGLRLCSAFFGLVFVVATYIVARSFYSVRIALLACAMVLGTSWFLLIARLATPDIFSTLLILIIGCVIWIRNSQKHKLTLFALFVGTALALYIPGAVWIILAAIIWNHRELQQKIRQVPLWFIVICGVTSIIIVLPILLHINNLTYLGQLSGLPQHIVTPKLFMLNVYHLLAALLWDSRLVPSLAMGSQGLLSVFAVTMVIAGLIATIKRMKRPRSIYLISCSLLTIFLLGLGGTVSNALLLPYIILLITIGMGWMLQQWLTVFPKNPFARTIGMTLLVACVVLSATYNIYRYFVALPHMTTTKIVYNQRL